MVSVFKEHNTMFDGECHTWLQCAYDIPAPCDIPAYSAHKARPHVSAPFRPMSTMFAYVCSGGSRPDSEQHSDSIVTA